MKIKTKITILFMVIITITGSCKDKDKTKNNANVKEELINFIEFEKKGGLGGICEDDLNKYRNNETKYFPHEFVINAPPDGEIFFKDIDPTFGGGVLPEKGIPYKTYKKDIDKKQISFYLENGMLIIIIEFIDNDHFKIVEVGDWIGNLRNTNDPFLKKIDNISSVSLSNFYGGSYRDKNRIYTVN